jgi:signal transduction histidine kinase
VVVQSAAVGWGLFIHFRRQLVLSLRDRANRAETEAQLRAEQAQQRARDEIAREMHDVLGHRLSLLSVHAGALEFRPDAPAGEVARAAKVIRENATRPSRTCVRSSASCAPPSASCPSRPWPTSSS